jgi:phenylacetate-CoA ligase
VNNGLPAKMDFYTALISGALFPLHDRLTRHHSTALRRQMEQSQWWPAERLQALQLARLHQLLAHAEAKVPYYRNLFAETGFKAADLHSLADLARLPFLDKASIRAHTDALKADDANGLARFNTGGSSGEPLIF